MQMRPSRVLRKLRAGQLATCAKMTVGDPRVAEIAAMSGFDCIWIDQEHIPTDFSVMEHQIRAAKIYDVDAMVRVRRGSYSDHIVPLEADASGIMVPHVMSLADAKKVVWNTKFHPIGRRPLDGGNTDNLYGMVDLQDYLKTANQQRFVMIQIEDPEPMDELEQIAKLPGIDMLFFGPADFSQGIGAPAQWDHPKIDEARRRVAKVAMDNGKFAGTMGYPHNMQQLVDMGYRFLNATIDTFVLRAGFAAMAKVCQDVKLP